jgi:hypothetical protein
MATRLDWAATVCFLRRSIGALLPAGAVARHSMPASGPVVLRAACHPRFVELDRGSSERHRCEYRSCAARSKVEDARHLLPRAPFWGLGRPYTPLRPGHRHSRSMGDRANADAVGSERGLGIVSVRSGVSIWPHGHTRRFVRCRRWVGGRRRQQGGPHASTGLPRDFAAGTGTHQPFGVRLRCHKHRPGAVTSSARTRHRASTRRTGRSRRC